MPKNLKWKVQGSERIMNGIWSGTELCCNSGKGSSEGRYFYGVVLVCTSDPWCIAIYLCSEKTYNFIQYHQPGRKWIL